VKLLLSLPHQRGTSFCWFPVLTQRRSVRNGIGSGCMQQESMIWQCTAGGSRQTCDLLNVNLTRSRVDKSSWLVTAGDDQALACSR
jgi:hypothetical protein